MIRDTSVKGDVRYTKSICQKKCTRQSLKVLWVVFSSLFFIEIWKNGMRGHGRKFVTAAKWKQQKWIRQQQSWGKVYRSYPILPFGTVAWTFFPTTILEMAALYTFVTRGHFVPRVICKASLVERTRLSVQIQSAFNFLGENGRRVTKVYCVVLLCGVYCIIF